MTPYAFGRQLGMQLREKQAIGFGDIGKGFQNAGKALHQGAQDYGHQLNSFYNPWSEAFHAPAGPHASDNVIRNIGRGAMGLGAGAAAAAGGIAAAPAISAAGSAVSTAAPHVTRGLGQAYKAYKTVSSPALSHATKLLPEVLQPAASTAVRGTSLGLTGATAYGTYDSAATAAGDSAQRLARTVGVADPKVLQEVDTRARSQMLPVAYRALAPSWLGGDTSPLGQQVRKDLGTVAYHNVGPAMLRPSASSTTLPLRDRALQGALLNPVSAVTSAVLSPRPTPQQMWQNVPAERRQQISTNMLNTATADNSNSPLAQSVQHIFAPAVQHQQQNVQNMASAFANNFRR